MADALSTVRNRVKLKVGNKSGIDDYIDEAINEAILQVIQEAKPQEMWATTTFSTSNATASYAFTGAAINKTDVYSILFVRDVTDDVEVKHTSYEVWNRYTQSTSNTSTLGAPRLWTRLGNNLILFSRIPDSTSRTIGITYLKRPTRLSADSDTFPLNDEWKRPVEELAAAYVFMDLNAADKSAAKKALYDDMMSRRTSPEAEEDASPWGSAFTPIHNLNTQS